ncbi:acyl-CoA thioesterase [Nocardia aurea]|uniref:Acyl-CoA thioesterase domain-containing protein n=1 Tax=Nocardia aurea TaxID=2144174 RepID=A0ABV3FQU5_9NOCA
MTSPSWTFSGARVVDLTQHSLPVQHRLNVAARVFEETVSRAATATGGARTYSFTRKGADVPADWSDLLRCLELRSVLARSPESDSDTAIFEADSQHLELDRLFGGQVLAQFVRVAAAACPDKAVKSLHVQFIREGKGRRAVRYVARHVRIGRSFATLAIAAEQDGRVLATASVSLHVIESGPESRAFTSAVPSVLSPRFHIGHGLLPWEARSADDLNALTAQPPDYDLWMRTPTVDPALAEALVAYASDMNLIGTALRPFAGYNHHGNGSAWTAATTSHTVWFHRPFRTDDWLLLRHHSPVAAHSRCFGRGDVFTENGTLVASFAQEGLLRFHS